MFNFKEIERLKGTSNPFVGNGLRITKNALGASLSVAHEFIGKERNVALVKIEADIANQAIRLSYSEDGYRMRRVERKSGNAFYCTLPSHLQKLGVQRGDYLPVEGHQNVFQHVDFITAPLGDKTPEIALKPGDKVTWQARLNNKRVFVEGAIVEIYETTFGASVKKPAARVKVESEEYKKTYPNRGLTTVSIDKLIKFTQE